MPTLVGSSGSAADTSAEPRTLGKYELVRLIARGGMGEVHLARLPGELGFEKLLVVKTVRTELAADPRFVELFATEAKTAVGLSHPNIAPIYELGRAPDGSLYTAMGWVDGPSLQVLGERLRELGRRLEPGAALFIAREILEGLAHAHRADRERPPIVHRDITPRNVLVDRSGRVQIVDFGIAKPADADASPRERTRTARAAGSVGYMAPEQARGELVDPRADVFSVGCVLYELLTNQRAFEREGVWMSPDFAAIPEPLHEPLARALDLDPQRRYADADGFRRALAPILAEFAPTFGSRDLGDLLLDLFPDGKWEDEQRPRSDELHTPATNVGGVGGAGGVGGRLQTFATRLPAETGRPITEPDFITGSVPALAPDLREIVDVREPDPPPTEVMPAEPTSTPRRASVWLLVLGIAAIAGLVGYLLPGRSRAPEDNADATTIDPAPEPEPPPPIRETPPPLPVAPDAVPNDPVARVELQVIPAQAEVRVDGILLSGPPYAIDLGDTTRALAVTLDGYHEHLETLDASAPLGSPLVITLAPLELGSLSVLAPAVAWAEVWVDGILFGTTPLTEKPLLEGKYKLQVRCTAAVCGKDQLLFDRHVRIKPGRTNKFSVD